MGLFDFIKYSNGYDAQGYSKDGYNRNGYDRNGYDRNGYDCNGYNRNGYDRSGYNRDGYDKNGYNREGYNQDGYDREGYDCEGYNQDGYDREGYNHKGYNIEGFDRENYDGEGYNREGFDREGYNREGFDVEGYDREKFNREGYNREGYDREGRSREDSDKSGYITFVEVDASGGIYKKECDRSDNNKECFKEKSVFREDLGSNSFNSGVLNSRKSYFLTTKQKEASYYISYSREIDFSDFYNSSIEYLWGSQGVCGISGTSFSAIDGLCWDGIMGKPDWSAYEYGYRGDLFDQYDFYYDNELDTDIERPSIWDYFYEDTEDK